MPGGRPLRLGPFIGGLNTGSDPTAIADAELAMSTNFELDIDGSLKSRPPFIEIDGHPNFTERIVLLCEAIFSGTHYIIGSSNDGVFYYANGAWTLITNTFRAAAAVQFTAKVYLVAHPSASNPGGKWDPVGGFVAVAAIPKGQAAVVHKERLFIVPGITATANPTRVTFTDPGNFDVWPASNFIDVGQGDGTNLIDITVYQDNLLLFKNQSTYVLAYDIRPADAVVRKISNIIGVDGQNCVVNYENQIYTVNDGWVYEIINYDFNRLNTKVPFVIDQTSPAPLAAEKQFLSLVGDRLILRVFSRVYVYGLRTRTWSEWTSNRDRLKFFGPILVIHADTGINEYYAGSSIQSFRTMIRIFNSQDAVNKEQVIDPTITITDTFTRTVSGGWGTTDTGQAWTVASGPTTDFSTNGTQGVISNGTLNIRRNIVLSTVSMKDVDVHQTIACGVVPTGGAITMSLNCRRVDANNSYFANTVFNTTGNVGLDLQKVVAGTVTTLGTVSYGTFTANEKLHVRLRAVGSSIKAKIWRDSVTEPVGWTHSYTDTSLTAAGSVSTDTLVSSVNTNVLPVTTTVDDYRVGNMATGLTEDIVCTVKTKNFDMAIPNQFKRLWWWGADVISNRTIVGTATPVVASFAVRWSELAAYSWNQLKTWAQPLTDISSVTTTVLSGTGTARRFVKFLKSLRYRQINFKIQLVTDGSLTDGPARLFTMTIITESKEGVSKGVS